MSTPFVTPEEAALLDDTAEALAAHLARTGHDSSGPIDFDALTSFRTWIMDAAEANLIFGYGVLVTPKAYLLVVGDQPYHHARRRYLAHATAAARQRH